MLEFRRFIIFVALALVGGVGLHRAIGAKAEPITVLILYTLALTTWRTRRRRLDEIRSTVIQLRQYEAEDRHQIVAALECDELRASVARELEREGSETRDGDTEVFPFPAGFRRRATFLYWRAWGYSATALLAAALIPDLDPYWRGIWLAVGLVLGYRAWSKAKLYYVARSVIELNRFRIAYVRPDGQRLTISFADGARCEDLPEHKMFVVRSGEVVIPVSYSLMEFNRIAQLVEDFGAIVPNPDPPAS